MRGAVLLVAIVCFAVSNAVADTKRPVARMNAEAPEFDLGVVQGEGSGKLSDHRGKVVMLKFWATYCGYCKSIRPKLIKFADKHADDVRVLAISFQGTGKLMRYLRKTTIGLPVLHDKRGRIARRYVARATPTLIVIDQCGVLRFHRSGARAAKKAMKVALELVAAASDQSSAQSRCSVATEAGDEN